MWNLSKFHQSLLCRAHAGAALHARNKADLPGPPIAKPLHAIFPNIPDPFSGYPTPRECSKNCVRELEYTPSGSNPPLGGVATPPDPCPDPPRGGPNTSPTHAGTCSYPCADPLLPIAGHTLGG